MPIISYYVKSLPLTHATPATCLCPSCQRFYFYNFVESSCVKYVLRTAHRIYCQITTFFFHLTILHFVPHQLLRRSCGVLHIKKKSRATSRKKFCSLACPEGTSLLFILGGILPPNPHEKKKNIKSCRLSKKT